MKESVFDIADLQEAAPFFRSRFGTWLGQKLIHWLQVDRVNQAHINNCHLRGAAFTTGLLSDPLIDVKYKVHNEELLDQLPEGAFVTVSNHPIGSIDGIILIDLFARRRPDFKVMVNGVLGKIWAMGDNFISVTPDSKNQGANLANVNGVRLSLQRLKEGHPMGFFPAGAISFYNKKEKAVRDLTWARSVIRLIRKGKVPVYPVYFDFLNSKFFYLLGRIDWRLRTLFIPSQAFNKRGKTVDVYIGRPISPEEIAGIPDDTELANLLYQRTYQAKG
ncbi:MAG: lysophospholipid acyltransferase family protein [Parabacteroides sp.]